MTDQVLLNVLVSHGNMVFLYVSEMNDYNIHYFLIIIFGH